MILQNIASHIHTRTHEKCSKKRFCNRSAWFVEIQGKMGLARVLIFRSKSIFGNVIVREKTKLFGVVAQGGLMIQGISQSFSERRFRQKERSLCLLEKTIHDTRGAFQAKPLNVILGIFPVFQGGHTVFDTIEDIGQRDEVFGLFDTDFCSFEKFPSRMTPLPDGGNVIALGNLEVAGIAVALQVSLEIFECVDRMIRIPVSGEFKKH